MSMSMPMPMQNLPCAHCLSALASSWQTTKSRLSMVPGRAEVSLKPSCASSTTHRTEYTPLESKCTIPYVR